ncbi:MAG TPA: hypothetical protein VGB73_16925 [Pyrinomonadaceae bacterium]
MKVRLTCCLILMLGLMVFVSAPQATYQQDAVEATVNPIDFMINRTSSGWCTNQSGWPRCIYFYQDIEPGTNRNRFFYIKDDAARYERFTWDANYISLDRDTTWFNTAHNADSYDAKPFGSLLWAKTYNWTTGQNISYRTRIVGFNVASCNYAQSGYEYDDQNNKYYEYYPARYWGGDIGYADSIRVIYPSGGEAHWYARDRGWVAWEQPLGTERFRWNYRTYTTVTPNACNDNLGDWRAGFQNQDTMRHVYSPDWDTCRGKANGRPGEAIVGISQVPGGFGRTALSRIGDTWHFTGNQTGRLDTDRNGDNRRAYRYVNGNPDWDYGYWKLECNYNEYVVGVSENHAGCYGNNHFHAVLCASGNGLSNNCSVRIFDGGDNRGVSSSGDWDFGAFKGECGPNQYLAGVSINPSTRRPHALLCCQY